MLYNECCLTCKCWVHWSRSSQVLYWEGRHPTRGKEKKVLDWCFDVFKVLHGQREWLTHIIHSFRVILPPLVAIWRHRGIQKTDYLETLISSVRQGVLHVTAVHPCSFSKTKSIFFTVFLKGPVTSKMDSKLSWLCSTACYATAEKNWEQQLVLLCMPQKTLKLKCHMCFTTETETTAMGWDSLTHVQSTAAEPDSGWHLEGLEFVANTDDKDSWLAHSSRSVEQSGQKRSGH